MWSSFRLSHEEMDEQTEKMTSSGHRHSPGGFSQFLKGTSTTLLLNSE